MAGKARSKALSKTGFRQLPSRTQTNVPVCSGLFGEMKEIFVFADHRSAIGGAVVPNVSVHGFIHFQVEHVLSIMSMGIEEPGECGWKLVIHEEHHNV